MLSKLDEDIPVQWEQTILKVKMINDKILKIVTLSLQGKPAEAYNALNLFLQKEKLETKQEREDRSYYRMRVIDNQRTGVKCKDLFHIPLEMRSIVKTQRYSTPGYPCLYMGNSVYACWEEMGRPTMHNCWFSRIKTTNDIKILDLRVPSKSKFKNLPILWATLFPIIIACMIPVKDTTAIFKPEYIFPQLILEWIISNKSYNGIYYSSTHKNTEFEYPDDKSYNIVIPVRNPLQSNGFCPNLKKTFHISFPINFEIENLRDPFPIDMGIYEINEDNMPDEIQLILDPEIEERPYTAEYLRRLILYAFSDFGQVERRLLSQPVRTVE